MNAAGPGFLRWAVVVGLFVLVAIVYAPVAHHAFIALDDFQCVAGNPHVNTGPSRENIRWAFTTGHTGNYIPLTWLSHQLDVSLWGNRAGPMALTNALIHACNAALLFSFLVRTTTRFWPAALVAVVFAVHPLNVESVAWVTERKNVLSLFFGLLALHAYVAYAHKPGVSRYAVMAFLFTAGLMSKSALVTWPAVLLLLDVWPLRRVRGPDATSARPFSLTWLVVEKVPLLILSAACALFTLRAQASEGAVHQGGSIDLSIRLGNAIVSYGRYIRRVFWPDDLAVFYPYVFRQSPREVMLALLLIVALTIFCLRSRKRLPAVGVGWLWFLGVLLPMIGIVQAGSQAMADRYFYHAGVGLIVALVWGCDALLNRAGVKQLRLGRPIVVAGSAVCLLGLVVSARANVGYWQRSETLFARAMVVTDDNWMAMAVLGAIRLDEKDFEQAEVLLRRAVQIAPTDAQALADLGEVYRQTNRPQEAEMMLSRAVELNGKLEVAKTRLALVQSRQ